MVSARLVSASGQRWVFGKTGDRVERQLAVDTFQLFEVDLIPKAVGQTLEADETS